MLDLDLANETHENLIQIRLSGLRSLLQNSTCVENQVIRSCCCVTQVTLLTSNRWGCVAATTEVVVDTTCHGVDGGMFSGTEPSRALRTP